MKIKLCIWLLIVLTTSLFAEKVSFKEITNVALNYYRQNVAPIQYEQSIIKDYDKAINLDSIKYELDSLVIENLTISYFFNFKPTGFIQIYTTDAYEPIASWAQDGIIMVDSVYAHRNDPGVLSTICFDKESNVVYKNYNKKPTVKNLKTWNYYKVEPKEFDIKKNSKNTDAGQNKSEKAQKIFTEWHQLDPCWNDCPSDSVNGHSVVGCVAVAMAQLMKYYQWPDYRKF